MLLSKNLLRLGWAQRWYFGLAALLGIAGGAISIWQARIFSQIIGQVFLDHFGLEKVGGILVILLGVMLLRACLLGGQEVFSSIGAFHLKLELRKKLTAVLPKMDFSQRNKEAAGELSQTYLDGVDALEAYFGQYIPQVFLAGFVPPLILIAVFIIDPLSGVVFLITGPLIPVFMRLIGEVANQQTHRQWKKLSILSAFLLEAIQALPMLKRLGITDSFVEKVAEKGSAYRQATLEVLKVTFLSAFVLELLTTLSTAVVAVQVGLRLLYGWIPFEQALFVLVIAPEFYLPLRQLGLRFHAGMNGVSSGERILHILNQEDNPSVAKDLEINPSPPAPQKIQTELKKGITFKQVTFQQPDRGVILEDIHFKLQPGEITVLMGESGSGKTTLVHLLLRFLNPTNGKILVGDLSLETFNLKEWWDCIAYLPQNPYFYHGTIFENICLGNPNIPLEKVIAAAKMANAHAFISALPNGYQTIIGEGGVGLSAGQAQRIALARAYLKNAPLLILDEGSANIDSESLDTILDSLIRYKDNRIILIITHQSQVAEIADKRFRLDKNFMENDEYKLSGVNKQSGDRLSDESLEDGGETFEISSFSKNDYLSESAALVKHPLLRLVRFLFPLWNWVTLAIILSVAAILSNVGLMYTSAYIISFAALQPSIAYLQVAIVGVRFFGISRGVWRYLERLISHRVTLDLLTRMRVWFYQALEPLLPNLFLSYPSGDLMSRLLGDIAALEPFYVRAIAPFLTAIVVGCVISLAFVRILPFASILLVILFLIAGLVLPFIYERVSEKFVAQMSELRGELNARLVNLIQGLGELLVNHRFPYFEERIHQLAGAFGRSHLNFGLLNSSQFFLMNGLAYFAMWGILWIAIPEVVSGRLAGVILAGIGLAVYVSFEAFMGLPNAGQVLANSRQAAGRLFELSDQAIKPKEVEQLFIKENSRLDFEFKKVTFSYQQVFPIDGEPSNHNTLPPAVEDIDIVIPFGKHIGIIGPSGSGKTTLLNLLMGLYPAQQGEILVNGRELNNIDLVSLRRNISSSGQDDFFFHDTLESNLCLLNPHASKSQVEAVLKAACLEELVNSLPDGLNTVIGEQGKQLSGGERKRVLIARTLLRDAPIYIFDEPFAQLDETTARLVLQNILHWCAGKTLLIVSHLYWGFDALDEIIVMDRGRVVQRGRFSEIDHSFIR